jgi:hypothetical protein
MPTRLAARSARMCRGGRIIHGGRHAAGGFAGDRGRVGGDRLPGGVGAVSGRDGVVRSNLAEQLQNPVANLISVPFQNIFDYGGAKGHSSQYTVNIQPVIPFKLTPDWNLIVRTIVPVTMSVHVQPTEVSGLADIVQSFFFSPAQPIGGLIVGMGPVFLYPTATNVRISANQWAAKPTAVVLKQAGPWTVGYWPTTCRVSAASAVTARGAVPSSARTASRNAGRFRRSASRHLSPQSCRTASGPFNPWTGTRCRDRRHM